MKISVCMVVQDDLPFLEQAIQAANQYADEIVVLDNGSVDGTWEFLTSLSDPHVLGDKIKSVRSYRYDVLKHGFSYMKNLAVQIATGDWIHSLDADECLSADQRPLIRAWLERCTRQVVSIRTVTFYGDVISTDFTALSRLKSTETRHRRIYRRDAGIEWKGYLHEELFHGDTNCVGMAENSHLAHWHFTNFRTWQNPRLKAMRYAWMLTRASKDPELQKWTNGWWYKTYVQQNREALAADAAEFQQILDKDPEYANRLP